MLQDRNNSLETLIENLRKVKVNGDPIAELRAKFREIQQKCDKAFLPFAESELEFVDREHMDEAAAHIVALHEGAFTLRRECDSLLRSDELENSDISSSAPRVLDTFLECCARVENIYNLRRPDLLLPLDAVL